MSEPIGTLLNLKSMVYDEWLTGLLGKQSYRFLADQLPVDALRRELQFLVSELRKESLFLYSKVSVEALAQVKFLEEARFNLVDTCVTFARQRVNVPNSVGSFQIGFANPEDADGVARLAKRSFRYSRFHRDASIPTAVANTIKEEWARNYFLGKRGNQMVVAKARDEIIGFLQLVIEKEKSLITIDLISVDERWRGQGVATGMIYYAERTHADCARIQAGTQLANVPSVRLYEKMGFQLASAEYIFHRHFSPEAP